MSSLPFLSVHFNSVNIVVQWISRTFSSCKTDTVYPWSVNCPLSSPTFCSYTFDHFDGSYKEKSCSACLWTRVGTHLFTIQLSILWRIYPDKGVVVLLLFHRCVTLILCWREMVKMQSTEDSQGEYSRFVLPFLCVHFLTSLSSLFSVLLLGLV